MNTAIDTVGTWGFDPVFKVFNAVNQGVVKFVATPVKFIEATPKINGTIALLELAKMAEEKKWEGPSDLATNHDKYFYEAWKAEKQTSK